MQKEMKDILCNDLNHILVCALEKMKQEQGSKFHLDNINLSELSRRTGISRSRLRRWKANGFKFKPHGLKGRVNRQQCLSGYMALLDDLLKKGIANSTICFAHLKDHGYAGSLSTVKRYIASHKNLIPAKRCLVESRGNRGIRYFTEPGEAFQMDWGFVNVQTSYGDSIRAAAFALICHHCGMCYVEFFPNAKQENLFIGMLHGFQYMGIPRYILTDNMKSVVLHRDSSGFPIWQKDYESFMEDVGFKTKLCKPRHPYTKGKVERLIRFVKENFLPGRSFWNITDLNRQCLAWCETQNRHFHSGMKSTPETIHASECAKKLGPLTLHDAILFYLCPERKVSFDGFVTYEQRRFGVPLSYSGSIARVKRDQETLFIYSDDMKSLLVTYPVTWTREDRLCKDQYVKQQPEELPTAPVRATIRQLAVPSSETQLSFEKFNFSKGGARNE